MLLSRTYTKRTVCRGCYIRVSGRCEWTRIEYAFLEFDWYNYIFYSRGSTTTHTQNIHPTYISILSCTALRICNVRLSFPLMMFNQRRSMGVQIHTNVWKGGFQDINNNGSVWPLCQRKMRCRASKTYFPICIKIYLWPPKEFDMWWLLYFLRIV